MIRFINSTHYMILSKLANLVRLEFACCRYVNSAKIEAQVLNDIYHEQKRQGFDGCVKIYSHFKFNGKWFHTMNCTHVCGIQITCCLISKFLPLHCIALHCGRFCRTLLHGDWTTGSLAVRPPEEEKPPRAAHRPGPRHCEVSRAPEFAPQALLPLLLKLYCLYYLLWPAFSLLTRCVVQAAVVRPWIPALLRFDSYRYAKSLHITPFLRFLLETSLSIVDLKVENILFASPELDYGSDGIPLPTSPKIKCKYLLHLLM